MRKKLLFFVFATILVFTTVGFVFGEEVQYRETQVLEHHGMGRVEYLAWTSDGKKLLAASSTSITAWETASWKSGLGSRNVAYPDEIIHGMVTSPDGKYYAIAVHSIERNGIVVVHLGSGQVISDLTLGRDEYVDTLYWANNNAIVAGLIGGIAKLWMFSEKKALGNHLNFYNMFATHMGDVHRRRVWSILFHNEKFFLGGGGFIAAYKPYQLQEYSLEKIYKVNTAVEQLIASSFDPDAVLASILHERFDGGRIIEVGPSGVRNMWSWEAVEYADWATSAVYALAERTDGVALFATGTGMLRLLTGPNQAETLYQYSINPTDLNVDFVIVAPHPTNPNIIAFAPGDGKILILER